MTRIWSAGSISADNFHQAFSFQPVLHDWCNGGRGMCYPVCGMVYIKKTLLLIEKSSPCGGTGLPLSLSEWSLMVWRHITVNKMCRSIRLSDGSKTSCPSVQWISALCWGFTWYTSCTSFRSANTSDVWSVSVTAMVGRVATRSWPGFNMLPWHASTWRAHNMTSVTHPACNRKLTEVNVLPCMIEYIKNLSPALISLTFAILSNYDLISVWALAKCVFVNSVACHKQLSLIYAT